MVRFFIITIYLLCVSAPAYAADEIAPNNDANTLASMSEKVSEKVQEVLLNALNLTGIQYKYGGNSPETGFDCSGFVRYVFKQALNLTLPHNARAMSQIGMQVAQSQLKPGDLVFFNTLKTKFSHVGIYIGDNRFIHSPSAGKEIKVVSMKESYWLNRYNGAVRVEHLGDVASLSGMGNLGNQDNLSGAEPGTLKNVESIEMVIEEESPQRLLK